MFRSSYTVATVWGIPIKVHVSLLVVALFYAWQAGRRAGMHAVPYTIALTIALFASVALHELGHSFVALRKGCRVREITLLFIGGAAMMEEIPRRPFDEFQMAIAGPLVSLVLGAGALAMSLFGPSFLLTPLLFELGVINIALAVFNLLPSFPMDGGRVFRALLTPKLGRVRATYIASRLGKFMAMLFGLYGLINRMFFLTAIAFFIYTAAENEYRMVVLQERGGLRGSGGPFAFRPPPVPPPSTLWDDADDDEVSISPPPYRRGPGQRAPIRQEEDNPFRNLFR